MAVTAGLVSPDLLGHRAEAGMRCEGGDEDARAPTMRVLPINNRAVVWVETGTVLLGLANQRHQLVLVYGNTEARLGRQLAMPVLHRRQRFREEVGVLRIAALLDEEVRDRRGNLEAGRQRARSLRIVRREPRILIVEVVHQEAGGDDVTAGDIGLGFGQVANAKEVIVVGIGRQFGIESIITFAVESIVEPHFSFPQRTGKSQARQDLVELPSSLVLKRRYEIGGIEV